MWPFEQHAQWGGDTARLKGLGGRRGAKGERHVCTELDQQLDSPIPAAPGRPPSRRVFCAFRGRHRCSHADAVVNASRASIRRRPGRSCGTASPAPLQPTLLRWPCSEHPNPSRRRLCWHNAVNFRSGGGKSVPIHPSKRRKLGRRGVKGAKGARPLAVGSLASPFPLCLSPFLAVPFVLGRLVVGVLCLRRFCLGAMPESDEPIENSHEWGGATVG